MVETVFKQYAQVMEITIDGQPISTTEENPFYVVTRVEIEAEFGYLDEENGEERLGMNGEIGYDAIYREVSDNRGMSSSTAILVRSQLSTISTSISGPCSVSCHVNGCRQIRFDRAMSSLRMMGNWRLLRKFLIQSFGNRFII